MSTAAHYSDPLDRYAESAWRSLRLEPPADLAAVCVKLDILLKRQLMERDLCGFLIVTPTRRKVIVINDGMPIPRQRFTTAHEIGHCLVEPNRRPGYVCKMGPDGPRKDTTEERRCDRFAGALLAPHWLVRVEYERLASNPSGRIPIMADRFGVSRQAMRLRLRELRLES